MPTCPECGDQLRSGAPEGLCARCLMVQGIDLAAAPSLSDAAGEPGDGVRRIGDYDLLEEIARGGMGIVYRARQRSLDRFVAVKTLLFGPQASADYVKRFRAEASAAAALQHPGIVAIHEVGVSHGEHYLVMDLVNGPSLAKLIKDQPLPGSRAAAYLKSIAEAIQHAHERGVLHRDLKPSNVLIAANGQTLVTDFGLAKRMEGDSSLTLSGRVLGSPSYMPPEQAGATRHKVGRRSDVYSLGAMLYDMLVGRPPFVGESLNQTLDQVFHHEPVSPRLLNPGVPRDLETICLKCLEKDPAHRYATAQALADELGRFLRGEPILARPAALPEKLWRWCRRKPVLAALILLVNLVGVVGLAGIVWEWRRAEENLYFANVHLANEALEARDLAGTQLRLRNIEASHVPQSLRGWEWRYLVGRSRGDQLAILDTQQARFCGIAASSDGQYLACIGDDGLIKLWDFNRRKLINSWRAHVSPPSLPLDEKQNTVIFAPDGKTLITAGPDRFIRLWDLPSGRKRSEAAGLTGPATRLALSRTGQMLAAGSFYHGQLSLFSLSNSSPSLIHRWESQMPVLIDLSFAPDGLTLFAGGPTSQLVRRFDISDPTEPHPMPDLNDSDGPLAISPDGRWLATARADSQPFRVWALPSLEPVATNFVRGSRLSVMKFSPNSKLLAAGLEDGRIILWSMDESRDQITLLGHQKKVIGFAFSVDGKTLASSSFDKTVRLWDTASGERAKWTFRPGGSTYDVNFSPDSKRLVSVCQTTVGSDTNGPRRSYITQLWDVDERKGIVPQTATTNLAHGLNFHANFSSPDGALVAVDDYSTLRFLQVPTLTPVAVSGARLPCWGPDGRWLAYVDEHMRLVRSESPSMKAEVVAEPGSITALAVSADGRILASSCRSASSSIELRDARTGRLLGPPLMGHEGWVSWVTFSPDGKTLASAGWSDGWLGIWDVAHQRRRDMLRGHNGSVYKVAFSPDGLTLATCGSDETVRLWNVARLQEVAVLQGHRGPVSSVAFSPDGRWLASASSDGTILLRSAPTFPAIAVEKSTAKGQ